MTTPDLSVVIPTRDRPAPLAVALRSVLAQVGAPTFEVVVVDNDVVPSAQAMVESLATTAPVAVRYVHEARAVKAAGVSRTFERTWPRPSAWRPDLGQGVRRPGRVSAARTNWTNSARSPYGSWPRAPWARVST